MQITDKQNLSIQSNGLPSELPIEYGINGGNEDRDYFSLLMNQEMAQTPGSERSGVEKLGSEKKTSAGTQVQKKDAGKDVGSATTRNEQVGNKVALSSNKKEKRSQLSSREQVREGSGVELNNTVKNNTVKNDTVQSSRDSGSNDNSKLKELNEQEVAMRYISAANNENKKIYDTDGKDDDEEIKSFVGVEQQNESSVQDDLPPSNNIFVFSRKDDLESNEDVLEHGNQTDEARENAKKDAKWHELQPKEVSAKVVPVLQPSAENVPLAKPETVHEARDKAHSAEPAKEISDAGTNVSANVSDNVISITSSTSKADSGDGSEQSYGFYGNAALNNTSVATGAMERTAEAIREANANAPLNAVSVPSGVTEKIALWSKTDSMLNGLSDKIRNTVVGKIQDMIENVKKTRVSQTMIVRLDPPQLGEVTLRITQKDDKIFARIIPESREIEAHLRGKSDEIRNILANSGIKTENVNLSFGFDNFENETNGFKKMFAGYNLGDSQREKHFTKQPEGVANMTAVPAEVRAIKAYGTFAGGWIA